MQRQFKRGVAVLLACLLLVGLLPIVVSAGEPGELTALWVNGEDMLNGGAVPGVSFDAASETLTLTNVNITKDYAVDENRGYPVYVKGGNLKIVLKGENIINSDYNSDGIYVEEGGSLTITGDGSLDVEGGHYAVYVDDDLIIDSSVKKITASGDGFAFFSQDGVIIVGGTEYRGGAGDVTVEYGVLTQDLVFLWVNGVDMLKGGTVPNVAFDRDTHTLTLNSAVIDNQYFNSGIYALGDLTIVLKGSSVISGDGIREGIYIAGNLTLTGDGTLSTSGTSYGLRSRAIMTIDESVGKITAYGVYSALYSEIDDITVGGTPYSGDTKFMIINKGVISEETPVTTLWVNDEDMLNGGVVNGVSFDKNTGVLILDGAVIDKGHKYYDGNTEIVSGIYAQGDLTVVLKGDNVISGESMQYGLDIFPGSLTIIGDGSLRVEGLYSGIYSDSDINMYGGDITSVGLDETDSNGIYISSGDFVISGGQLEAYSNSEPLDLYSSAIGTYDGAVIVSPREGEEVTVFAGTDSESSIQIDGSPFGAWEDITAKLMNMGYFSSTASIPNSVTPGTQQFDKNGFEDTVFTITAPESVTLTDVYVDGDKLTKDVDYNIFGYTVMFTESYNDYLISLNGKTLTVKFDMSWGRDPEVKLVIPQTYAITIVSSPADGGYWYADGYSNSKDICYVVKGEEVELGASEYYGYRFVRWEQNGQPLTEDEYYVFTPNSDCTLTIVFEKLITSLSVSPETLDFGLYAPGYTESPEPQTVTVKNNGEMPVLVAMVVSSNYDIMGLDDEQLTLEVGESFQFTVRPKAGLDSGDYSEAIKIYGRESGGEVARVMAFRSGPQSDFDVLAEVNAAFQVGYTLTFETNGGRDIAPLLCKVGEVIDLSDYKPTNDGYTFTGWFADKGLTEKLDSVTLDGDKTVYAGWTYVEDAETGDNDYTALWISLLFVSGAGVVGIAQIRRKKTIN